MRVLYLVAYDITDDRRRTHVFETLRGFGDWQQFSIFRCELSETELVRLKARLSELIHRDEDQILFANLGPADGRGREAISALGKPYFHAERRSNIF